MFTKPQFIYDNCTFQWNTSFHFDYWRWVGFSITTNVSIYHTKFFPLKLVRYIQNIFYSAGFIWIKNALKSFLSTYNVYLMLLVMQVLNCGFHFHYDTEWPILFLKVKQNILRFRIAECETCCFLNLLYYGYIDL